MKFLVLIVSHADSPAVEHIPFLARSSARSCEYGMLAYAPEAFAVAMINDLDAVAAGDANTVNRKVVRLRHIALAVKVASQHWQARHR